MNKDLKQWGFTLLEMIIVISIFTILGLAIANFGRDIFWQNLVVSKTLVAESETKLALARLVSELRRAQTASTGSYPLELVSPTEITFYSDIDNNGAREKMHYWLNGQTLKRGITRPTGQPYTYDPNTEVVGTAVNDIANASSTIFSYYNKNYDGTASSTPLSWPVNVNEVRLIKIELSVDANPNQSPLPLFLSSQVMLRNLKDNL